MTASAERRPAAAPAERSDELLGEDWRARARSAQETILPGGRVVVSCGAPYGAGGLGRHLREIVEALLRRGSTPICICADRDARAQSGEGGSGEGWAGAEGGAESPDAPGPPAGRARLPGATTLAAPLARFSPGWRIWKTRVEFDARAARQLPAADHLIAFNRQALGQFGVARTMGYGSLSLMTGSPHVRRVASQHARARRQYPLERSFGTHIVGRYLTEYEQADRIYVASRYAWESFVEHGVSEERLAMFPLTPDPRFVRAVQPPRATFEVVYVGGLSVAKGVPLLVDAVRRLPHPDLRLRLVGSWKTRGMRRFLEGARAADPRIEVCPGDPLPHLQGARLCVHPTYEDGFAYAPVEALACGVPVLVSEDTGMKDLVEPGRNGRVLPTGDLAALTEAIEAAYRGELLGGG